MSDLHDRAKAELAALTLSQRRIVLAGLHAKFAHLARTGVLSYKYEVCPVCLDVGSTLENPKCEQCYIPISCKVPFELDFRDDQDRGAIYFADMDEYLMSTPLRPKALVVGGTWWEEKGHPSKIAATIAEYLSADLVNGGRLDDLPIGASRLYDLVVWIPKIPNDAQKRYPIKKTGAVLIVSKVMHSGIDSAEAAKRIFAVHGNAVIEIHSDPIDATSGTKYALTFRLKDALSVEWACTRDVKELCTKIKELEHWTNGAMRSRSHCFNKEPPITPGIDEDVLLQLTHEVAERVQNEVGKRYFGNVSTRCMKLFPSIRGKEPYVFVSARNIDKRTIELEDLVLATLNEDGVIYWGDRKPSVDTPVQLALYKQFPQINYMIHGHAYVKGAPTTENYFPCGDLREWREIANLINERHEFGSGAINLRNHGFLLYATDLDDMQSIIEWATIVNRL